jgi:membrane protease YdiL (CAAX protease family)
VPFLPFTSRHPYLATIVTTVALVVSLGIAGTALYLSGHTTISPVAVVFPLILLGIAIQAVVRRRLPRALHREPGGSCESGASGGVSRGVYLLAVAFPMGVLVLTAVSVGGYPVRPPSEVMWFITFALLIGVVEELVYRGWFLSLLLPRGRAVAVLVSSVLFAVSHAVNALAGQDVATSIRQIIFAFLFGIVAALLYLILGTLWVAIGFHTLNDLVQFLGAKSTTPVTDLVCIGMLVAAIVVLLPLMRRANKSTPVLEMDCSKSVGNATPRLEPVRAVTFDK